MYEYFGLTVHLNFIKILHYKKSTTDRPLFYQLSVCRTSTGCIHHVTKPFCYLRDSDKTMRSVFNPLKPGNYCMYPSAYN